MNNINDETQDERLVCGIVMPISTIDGCSESHWVDVKNILSESISEAGFIANLVSEADDSGIIHKRIIQNLYENPVVVCDVSAKNANVMFELGIRVAFDKPTIIVKDDKTAYSFDTSIIEHIEYPRDLRYAKILEFQEKLRDKISKTHENHKKNPDYSTFLKNFGEFKVVKLETKEVSKDEYILDELKNIRSILYNRQSFSTLSYDEPVEVPGVFQLCGLGISESKLVKLILILKKELGLEQVFLEKRGENHNHLVMQINDEDIFDKVNQVIKTQLPEIRKRIRPYRGGKSNK